MSLPQVSEPEIQAVLDAIILNGNYPPETTSTEAFRNSLKLSLSVQRYFIEQSTGSAASSGVPTLIEEGEEWGVPEKSQMYAKLPMHVRGDSHIRGDLIDI